MSKDSRGDMSSELKDASTTAQNDDLVYFVHYKHPENK